jgi:hypothetical protein
LHAHKKKKIDGKNSVAFLFLLHHVQRLLGRQNEKEERKIIAIKNAIMGFVITNNVDYYDFRFEKAIKYQLQSFLSSFLRLLFC